MLSSYESAGVNHAELYETPRIAQVPSPEVRASSKTCTVCTHTANEVPSAVGLATAATSRRSPSHTWDAALLRFVVAPVPIFKVGVRGAPGVAFQPFPPSYPKSTHNWASTSTAYIKPTHDTALPGHPLLTLRMTVSHPHQRTSLGSSSSVSSPVLSPRELTFDAPGRTSSSLSSTDPTRGHPRPSHHRHRSSTSSHDEARGYYYGRHSNKWLFGGFSVRDTVGGAFKKIKRKVVG
ncbi:uncharacterized protein B0I36DRAFT_343764 [Microdochium trichocladiopsis]|uniref:Uncharacterized protein n=1 Tax=Microdochium trichocladiopsis TaxID=1682393 RepID=A0A9P9BZB8_9PEZI|nr:uncharacterized protein B0I36DRAFT_343764 [Microdochium trichocladiopsis]KAH7039944.1 hypothetical protein B0I36DRAFT_343764 [Microdochium trichocladiopsis]